MLASFCTDVAFTLAVALTAALYQSELDRSQQYVVGDRGEGLVSVKELK